MIGKKIVRAAVLALAVAAPMAVATGTAHAAPGSDLDLTKCQIVDDPVNYGDNIDWYKLEYTYVNEGTAPTGDFTLRVRPVWGKDMFSGKVENEAHLEQGAASLAPGQSRSGFYWLTKKAVDQKTWGMFLDVKKVTGQAPQQQQDDFCSAFVNNT